MAAPSWRRSSSRPRTPPAPSSAGASAAGTSLSSGTTLISAAPNSDASIARHMADVLVTGAAGGIGGAVVDALLARGDRVLALDRIATARGDVRELVVDAGDPAAVTAALAAAAAGGYALRHVVAIAGGALHGEKTCTDPAELPL